MEKIYVLQLKTDEETYANNNLNQTDRSLMIIYISSNAEQIASRFYKVLQRAVFTELWFWLMNDDYLFFGEICTLKLKLQLIKNTSINYRY